MTLMLNLSLLILKILNMKFNMNCKYLCDVGKYKLLKPGIAYFKSTHITYILNTIKLGAYHGN